MKKRAPFRVRLMRHAWAVNDRKRDKNNKKPEGVMEYNNIVYTDNEEKSQLNLYIPEGKVEGKWPVVVSIHGGGYFYGSKELYSFYCLDIAKRGFAVINFDYRLAPEYRFPAPLEDTNAVMSWLIENANKYGLDTERVFMVGDSAGAQLVSHYVVMYANPDFAKLHNIEVPNIKIRAISLACGIYDVKKRVEVGSDTNIMDDYLGPGFDMSDPRLDVLGHINENFPATYVFSSYNDFLLSQCQPMADFLKEKGIEVKCKIYGAEDKKEIAHVFHEDFRYPEGEEARTDQAEFFKKRV